MTSLRGRICRIILTIGALTVAFTSSATVAIAQLTIPPAGMTESQFEALINAEISLDMATLLPPGTRIIDRFCWADSFLGCIGSVDVTIDSHPAPRLGGQSVDVGALSAGEVLPLDLALTDIAIKGRVDSASGQPVSCDIDIANALTTVSSTMVLYDDPLFPDSFFDATQVGSVSIDFGPFTDSTDCDSFMGAIAFPLVDLFITNTQNILDTNLKSMLNAVDGEGNTPIAAAVEIAYLAPPKVPALGPFGIGLLIALLSIGPIAGVRSSGRPDAWRE
jgi:hypothetical protein